MTDQQNPIHEEIKRIGRKNDDPTDDATITKAPAVRRNTIYALYGREENGKLSGPNTRYQRILRACRDILNMPPAEMDVFFKSLFPQMGKFVARAVRAIDRQPFHRYYFVQRAYRIGPVGEKYVRQSERLELKAQNTAVFLSSLLKCRTENVVWVATRLAQLSSIGMYAERTHWPVVSAAIDAGGAESEELLRILIASTEGTHEVGEPSNQAYAALMSCNNPAAWDFVEKMLRAAQREEGLRQSILEQSDIAHPTAFRRMLRLIVDENMIRFSSVARAADVWFGLMWDSEATGPLRHALTTVLGFLEDASTIPAGLNSTNAQEVYFALYALAFDDVGLALEASESLLQHAEPAHRMAALRILLQANLLEACRRCVPVVDDPDIRVAYYAAVENRAQECEAGISRRLRENFARWPKQQDCAAILFPWIQFSIKRSVIADKLIANDENDLLMAIPFLMEGTPSRRASFINHNRRRNSKPDVYREFLLQLAGDAGSGVPKEVYAALGAVKPPLCDGEWCRIEQHLERKAAGLRKEILDLAIRQSDGQVLRTATRLTEGKALTQRTAGLELLRRLVDAKRVVAASRAVAAKYAATVEKPTEDETRHLEAIVGKPNAAQTNDWRLENSFGLVDPTQLTPAVRPKKVPFEFTTDATRRCIEALDALVHENRMVPVSVRGTEETELFGDIKDWWIARPNRSQPIADQVERFMLRDVWETWFTERPASMRDPDGLELARARAVLWTQYWKAPKPLITFMLSSRDKLIQEIFGKVQGLNLKYPNHVSVVLDWLVAISAQKEEDKFLLEASIQVIARAELEHVGVSKNAPDAETNFHSSDVRDRFVGAKYISSFFDYGSQRASSYDSHSLARLWEAFHWRDMFPVPHATKVRSYPPLVFLAAAWREGKATDADLIHTAIQSSIREREPNVYYSWSGGSLSLITSRSLPPYLKQDEPRIRAISERIVERILEIELARGEQEAMTSKHAFCIGHLPGSHRLVRVLLALGKLNLRRDDSTWNHEFSRESVFSMLIRASSPDAADLANPEEAAARLRDSGVGETRLVEVGMFNREWARIIEIALGWDHFAEAVAWFRAHTKDSEWRVGPEIREQWAAELAERTSLTATDLTDGAVDVAWFHACYSRLGDKRWDALYKAAKYICSNIGHSRARLYGEALRGALNVDEMLEQIASKRNQDRVRALGLIPLASGAAAKADLLRRYEAIEEFIRTSKQFGSQRRASEARAAEIALDNLARTAGYADPLRLRWAMEINAMSDLRTGSKSVTRGEVVVTLTIDELGDAEISVVKGGKVQKAIPSSLKKDPEIVELGARKSALRKQTSRVRKSLEEAMIRGDEFAGSELQSLSAHPLLAPMIASLVFLNEEGEMGWLADSGTTFRGLGDADQSLTADGRFRIAHPHDLLASGAWAAWQRECFRKEIVQPFKQVFRELYIMTEREQEKKRDESSRYAGHQLQPRQAMGVLGSRGWVASYEEGVRRTWFKENINAWISFEEHFYSPAEVEGLTMGTVSFTQRGKWQHIPLAEVPPCVFSETMRDIDLVVSVAHRAGVDPEASESSIEARGALVRETAAVLKQDNVRVEGRHAIIVGELAEYSLNLGSAEAAVVPGGHLFIVAVHAAHRGRLFLPFVDDDPKSAELVSKMLMLARDKQIKDPGIRDQIRRLKG